MKTTDTSDSLIPLNRGNALTALTRAQQEQLFDWLELLPASEVLRKVTAPPPEGFGIYTHLTSLRRFHIRARAAFRRQIKEDAVEIAAADSSNPAPMNPCAPDSATLIALRNAALEMAAHQHDPAQFAALSRWVLRLNEQAQRDRELKLQEERLAVDREKFEFNAARAALMYGAQVREIMNDPNKDDEDKILTFRNKLFGPRSLLIEPKPKPQPVPVPVPRTEFPMP